MERLKGQGVWRILFSAALACTAVPVQAEPTLAGRMHQIARDNALATPAAVEELPAPVALAAPAHAFKNFSTPTGQHVSSTQEDSGPVKNTQQSPFQQLQEFYAQGTLPTTEAIKGRNVGRCFNAPAPTTPEGALLAGILRMEPADNGPLFPPKATLRIGILVSTDAKYFENMPAERAATVEEYVTANAGKFSPAETANGSLFSKYVDDCEYRTRKYQNYIIAAVIRQKDSGTHKAGDVGAMCYFFNKLP